MAASTTYTSVAFPLSTEEQQRTTVGVTTRDTAEAATWLPVASSHKKGVSASAGVRVRSAGLLRAC